MGIEKLNLDGLSTPDNVGQNEVVQGDSTDPNSVQNRIAPGAINPPILDVERSTSVVQDPEPQSLSTLGSDSTEKDQVRPEIRKSRILGEFSVYFHKDDYTKLKTFLEKTYDKNKSDIVKHIEAEQKRLEKKLKKLFVLEEKITGQKSDKLLEALKNLPDKGTEEVPIYGGKKDVDGIASDVETINDKRKFALYKSSGEDNEAVSYYVQRIKDTYEYGINRAKNISYTVMSLLYRYGQLSIVKGDLEDDRYQKSINFMDRATGQDKSVFSNIGPIEETQPT